MLPKASLPIFNDTRTRVKDRDVNVVYDPDNWAKDYSYTSIMQLDSGVCAFAAALASAANAGIDLNSRIKRIGTSHYSVTLYDDPSNVTIHSGLKGLNVFFDGTVYPQDLQPTSHPATVGGQVVKMLDNYWPLLFARAFLQHQKAWEDWSKQPSPDVDWHKGWLRSFFGAGGPWQSPKNASFALAGGVKNNWDAKEGMVAVRHLEQNLAKRSVCTVGTFESEYGASGPHDGHVWSVIGLSYNDGGRDGNILSKLLKWVMPYVTGDVNKYSVRLYNPWGLDDPIDLAWPVFAKSFEAITMVTQKGIEHSA